MSDLRSVFTSKDFVINSNVIKCISNLDITLVVNRQISSQDAK